MSEAAAGPETAGYVLVVGPDAPDRAWVEGTLLRGGFDVRAATEADILVALDIVPPRLTILDDSQSRPERVASLRHLQGHPALQGIPIVILAYDADIESYTEAITKGVSAYLVKPVSLDELVMVTQRLLGWMGSTDRTEKRRRLRRPLVMKVEVDIRSRKLRVPGQIVDVSGGGCRVELSEEVPKGELIRVVLHGHEASTHVALGGEVRWYNRAPDGTHVIGVRFTGTTALLAGKLLGFVSTGLT